MDIVGGLTPPDGLGKESIELKTIIIIFFAALIAIYISTLLILNLIKKAKTTQKPQCPICKKTSESYYGNVRKDKLCRVHAAMLRDNQITLCKYCGSWYNTNETCKCRKLDKS